MEKLSNSDNGVITAHTLFLFGLMRLVYGNPPNYSGPSLGRDTLLGGNECSFYNRTRPQENEVKWDFTVQIYQQGFYLFLGYICEDDAERYMAVMVLNDPLPWQHLSIDVASPHLRFKLAFTLTRSRF